MNVLLTCAGRRNYLIRFFREALDQDSAIIACNADQDAPALQEADNSYVLPPVTAGDYVQKVLSICERHRVGLLFSLNDLELPILAKHVSQFVEIGTIPVVSSVDVIKTCFDKFATVKFLERSGLAVPTTYISLEKTKEALSRGVVPFPLVIKPRWGSASFAIEYVDDEEELELAYRFVKKRIVSSFLAEASASDPERCVLIQEKLAGPEYHLDIVNDLESNYVCTFAKRKLAMRAGETDKAITVRSDNLEELGQMIGQNLGHVGNLDCDVFVGEKGCCVLEMNPRFGGGYPFSHLAGANLPAALIAWASGKTPDPGWLEVKPNVKAAKYDNIVIVKDL